MNREGARSLPQRDERFDKAAADAADPKVSENTTQNIRAITPEARQRVAREIADRIRRQAELRKQAIAIAKHETPVVPAAKPTFEVEDYNGNVPLVTREKKPHPRAAEMTVDEITSFNRPKARGPVSLDSLNDMDADDARRDSEFNAARALRKPDTRAAEMSDSEISSFNRPKARPRVTLDELDEMDARDNLRAERDGAFDADLQKIAGLSDEKLAQIRAQREEVRRDKFEPKVHRGENREQKIGESAREYAERLRASRPERQQVAESAPAPRRNEQQELRMQIRDELDAMGVPEHAKLFFRDPEIEAMLLKRGFKEGRDNSLAIRNVAVEMLKPLQEMFALQKIGMDDRGNPTLSWGKSLKLRLSGLWNPGAREKAINKILNSNDWQQMRAMKDIADAAGRTSRASTKLAVKGVYDEYAAAKGLKREKASSEWDAEVANYHRKQENKYARQAIGAGTAALVAGVLTGANMGKLGEANIVDHPVDDSKAPSSTTETGNDDVYDDYQGSGYTEPTSFNGGADTDHTFSFKESPAHPSFESIKVAKEVKHVKKAPVEKAVDWNDADYEMEPSAQDHVDSLTDAASSPELQKVMQKSEYAKAPKEVKRMINDYLELRRSEGMLDSQRDIKKVADGIDEALLKADILSGDSMGTAKKVEVYRKQLTRTVDDAFRGL